MNKKTKIVATIGPASSSKEVLEKLIKAGLNVVRINFSHGTYETNGKVIAVVRELGAELKRPVGVMVDLQGPRIRVGNAEPVEIETGETIIVSDKEDSSGKCLVIDSDRVGAALQVGERILIEDGLYQLEVSERISENAVKALVKNGGTIKPRKGINVPDTKLHFGAVTEKDIKDLEYALSQEVEFIALSFVSNAQEIHDTRQKMREILKREHNLPQIVAKIERKEAINNLDEIIKAADVIMVARGDLGIELNESRVVLYQKEIIAKCLSMARPVIVATQMLDSMINNPIPTRAEVSDVSNAVIDHTDAVMLSGESASGKFPVEAVTRMSEIIENTEESPFDDINPEFLDDTMFNDYASVINSAHELAKGAKAKAIIMFSHSGFTARMMAHHRPQQKLLVATGNEKTYRQLALVWGVNPYLFAASEKREEFVTLLIEKAKTDGLIEVGDKVVIILGRSAGDGKMQLVGIQEVA